MTVRPRVRMFGGVSETMRKGSPAVCQSSVGCQKALSSGLGEAVVERVGGIVWRVVG